MLEYYVECRASDMVASRLQQRHGLKHPYSDSELAAYNDMIDEAYGTIAAFGFDIVAEWMSSESYLY